MSYKNLNPLYEASTVAGKLGFGKIKAAIKGGRKNANEMVLPISANPTDAEKGLSYHILPGASRRTIARILKNRKGFGIQSNAGKYIKKITDSEMK